MLAFIYVNYSFTCLIFRTEARFQGEPKPQDNQL